VKLTEYPKVNELITQIENRIRVVLMDNLIGLYLYGSATAGDFEPDLSDIDLLAIVKDSLSDKEFSGLRDMHDQLTSDYTEWNDRIEIIYVPVDGLKNFKTTRIEVAEISPGEPFRLSIKTTRIHLKEIGDDWLINWYVIRQNGITIFGLDPKTVIPNISSQEYKKTIKKKVLLWQKALSEYAPESTRGAVAYAIFTLCRAMYSYENGEQASKKKSAEWVKYKFPEWKELINKAIEWRKVQWQDKQGVIGTELSISLDFLNFAINHITK